MKPTAPPRNAFSVLPQHLHPLAVFSLTLAAASFFDRRFPAGTRERDLPAAVAALSRAFDLDPLQMYVFPDPVERAARSPALFTPLLRYGLLFGEVLTMAGGPVGAAVWLGPAAGK